MKNTIFTGAGVAIVTPMHDDGSVNYAALGELIEMQIAGGTDAIIICGTTGESSTLTDDEHRECIRYTIEKVNKRIPVIAGTGSNDTAYAIELSKDAEAMGADGLLVVTPYYNKTSQRGLVAHYTAIADAVNIPIILYNVPSRTGVNISLDTYKISPSIRTSQLQRKPAEISPLLQSSLQSAATSLMFTAATMTR